MDCGVRGERRNRPHRNHHLSRRPLTRGPTGRRPCKYCPGAPFPHRRLTYAKDQQPQPGICVAGGLDFLDCQTLHEVPGKYQAVAAVSRGRGSAVGRPLQQRWTLVRTGMHYPTQCAVGPLAVGCAFKRDRKVSAGCAGLPKVAQRDSHAGVVVLAQRSRLDLRHVQLAEVCAHPEEIGVFWREFLALVLNGGGRAALELAALFFRGTPNLPSAAKILSAGRGFDARRSPACLVKDALSLLPRLGFDTGSPLPRLGFDTGSSFGGKVLHLFGATARVSLCLVRFPSRCVQEKRGTAS